jgi:hypothetical protein
VSIGLDAAERAAEALVCAAHNRIGSPTSTSV